jgi:hypothetical protein
MVLGHTRSIISQLSVGPTLGIRECDLVSTQGKLPTNALVRAYYTLRGIPAALHAAGRVMPGVTASERIELVSTEMLTKAQIDVENAEQAVDLAREMLSIAADTEMMGLGQTQRVDALQFARTRLNTAILALKDLRVDRMDGLSAARAYLASIEKDKLDKLEAADEAVRNVRSKLAAVEEARRTIFETTEESVRAARARVTELSGSASDPT